MCEISQTALTNNVSIRSPLTHFLTAMKTPKLVRIIALVFALSITLTLADQISSGMQQSSQVAA